MLKELIPWGWQRRRANDVTPAGKDAPEHPIVSMQREMNRVFDAFWRGFDLEPAGAFGEAWPRGADGFAPRLEVRDAPEKVTVTAELPGLSEGDVKVSFGSGTLTIEGEKRREEKGEKEGATYSELHYGSFVRQIPVRASIDEAAIAATFKNGVLVVDLPKSAQERESIRKIEVRSA